MLEPQEREALLSIAVEKVVKKGQLLYHQGDPCENLFIIQSGAVKVYYVHDNGSPLTTFYHRDGMLVGAHGSRFSGQSLLDGTGAGGFYGCCGSSARSFWRWSTSR